MSDLFELIKRYLNLSNINKRITWNPQSAPKCSQKVLNKEKIFLERKKRRTKIATKINMYPIWYINLLNTNHLLEKKDHPLSVQLGGVNKTGNNESVSAMNSEDEKATKKPTMNLNMNHPFCVEYSLK